MVENSGYGGAISAPIAQKLMTRYLFPERADSLLRSLELTPLLPPNAPPADSGSGDDATGEPIADRAEATMPRRN